MNKTSIQFIAFIAGCAALFIIGRQLIDNHTVPSLGEFLASSTAQMATSTAKMASSSDSTADILQMIDFTTPKGTIKVMVADTDASREQGLSYRSSLPANQGMLFVFDDPGMYAFWMKDMHFPLDMVWINSDKMVVGVSRDLSPDTYPSTFPPPSPVPYVLEINAGSADKLGLVSGAKIDFDLSQN